MYEMSVTHETIYNIYAAAAAVDTFVHPSHIHKVLEGYQKKNKQYDYSSVTQSGVHAKVNIIP